VGKIQEDTLTLRSQGSGGREQGKRKSGRAEEKKKPGFPSFVASQLPRFLFFRGPAFVWNFEPLYFEFVSDFEFRASSFPCALLAFFSPGNEFRSEIRLINMETSLNNMETL
jgi:hypothetical protein